MNGKRLSSVIPRRLRLFITFVITVIIFSAALLFTGCPIYEDTFEYDLTEVLTPLNEILSGLPSNTKDTPYPIELIIDNSDFYKLRNTLIQNPDKYVFLDLSGSPATIIPSLAFNTWRSPSYSGCDTLIGINIPDSVTDIKNQVFQNCVNLTVINIPDNVKSLGAGVFAGCTGLTAINVGAGNNLYLSDDGVLYNKNKTILEKHPAGKTDVLFTIPNDIKSISSYAFENCVNLNGVIIPDSVTNIGEHAFKNCTGLTGVNIPNSVKNIGTGVFEDCTGLTDVTMPNGIISIESAVFSGCRSLTDITIPDSVTIINNLSFARCTSLTNVIIPDSVKSIGNFAFSNCAGLTNAIIGNSVTDIGYSTFFRCTNLTDITLPNSIAGIGNYSFKECVNLTSITFMGTIDEKKLASIAPDGAFGSPFDGDLRAKFYETDAVNGTPGTYTTTAPVDSNSKWTKR
jgi:hypothetical protein